MHVVATAGHVDHGKSTLVEALTGRHPDRLEEERRRGLSIELGYAWTELPGVGEVAFVDVPGHERFLSTTLAGLGPVAVAMLVVAADDPWMPQAEEHLRILDALGVAHGVVVIARADLADPGPATAHARERVARTTLHDAPVVQVSARTGAGMGDLRAALVGVLGRAPRPGVADDVRLWVDRRFHVRGTGTVVTGTLPAGTITAGDVLATPDGQLVRVRNVEALGTSRDRIIGPARVALDLGGRAPTSLGRGEALLTPDAFVTTSVADVRVSGEGALPARPNLHLGSTQVGARTRPLDGEHYRITLEHPLPLHVGDRAILRDPGNRALWGVTVLDPEPPQLRARGSARARAAELAALDGSLAADLPVRGITSAALVRRLGLSGPPPEGTLQAGGWLVPDAEAMRSRLQELVPSGRALAPAEAARLLEIPGAVVEALVAPPLVLDAGRIRPEGETMPDGLRDAVTWLRDVLGAEPFAAPTADDLARAGLDQAAVGELHRRGEVERPAPGIVLLPDALDRAIDVLRTLPQPFTTSQARQALGTTRRVVLPLLARLDATARTVRLPDDTRRVRTPGTTMRE